MGRNGVCLTEAGIYSKIIKYKTIHIFKNGEGTGCAVRMDMEPIGILFLAFGLSMDAFAVAVCKGLSMQKTAPRHLLLVGAWFGGFQMLMPIIGYFLGSTFETYIVDWDHWVAFALLALIGGNMIRESFGKEEPVDASLRFRSMFPMAVATSIDALAVGITFALLADGVGEMLFASLGIGVVTFILSAVGVKVGSMFGAKYRSGAQLVGGVILVLLGAKILLEHLGILAF